ncbi:MAG: hypothetical protein KF788_08775 [Piscinibacter sp.]|nr:hypothetical protein [Piscinibacter sp.]
MTLKPPSLAEIGAALGPGISKQAASKLKKQGMPVDSIAAAQAWYEATIDLGRSKAGRIDQAPRTQTPAQNAYQAAEAGKAAGPAGDVHAPAGSSEDEADENTAVYREHRARRERLSADKAEIELEQLRSQLVPAAEFKQAMFTAGRINRDRFQTLPVRASAELHALLLSLVPEVQRASVAEQLDLHAFQTRLTALVDEVLTEANAAIEDAARAEEDMD